MALPRRRRPRPGARLGRYRELLIRPRPGGLTAASARYESVRGAVSTAWTRRDGVFELRVAVPPGATATVHIPTDDPDGVRETGSRWRTPPGSRSPERRGGSSAAGPARGVPLHGGPSMTSVPARDGRGRDRRHPGGPRRAREEER
ncbi:alpha-L-rhamnosidase C-terminal domain-containing protein [Actinomadura luteofluorescens]|uniref:alpha-L-rhamnosidase C-terminal domain-containing protein n=1 Tax=Actinomadura luteofluorescens TaxID=46163 RepID=UPI003625189A